MSNERWAKRMDEKRVKEWRVAGMVESVPCGGILKQRAGVISSPSDTEAYPHGTTCRYSLFKNTRAESRRHLFALWYGGVSPRHHMQVFTFKEYSSREPGSSLRPLIRRRIHTSLLPLIRRRIHTAPHAGIHSQKILKQRAGVISSPSDTEAYPHGTTCRYSLLKNTQAEKQSHLFALWYGGVSARHHMQVFSLKESKGSTGQVASIILFFYNYTPHPPARLLIRDTDRYSDNLGIILFVRGGIPVGETLT
jgi:hypothetical protein